VQRADEPVVAERDTRAADAAATTLCHLRATRSASRNDSTAPNGVTSAIMKL
jgi:hypothetical protein